MLSIKSVSVVLTIAVFFIFYFQIFKYLPALKAKDCWQETNFDSMLFPEISEYLKWENYGGCRFYQGI